jgi:hypothetical protein
LINIDDAAMGFESSLPRSTMPYSVSMPTILRVATRRPYCPIAVVRWAPSAAHRWVQCWPTCEPEGGSMQIVDEAIDKGVVERRFDLEVDVTTPCPACGGCPRRHRALVRPS